MTTTPFVARLAAHLDGRFRDLQPMPGGGMSHVFSARDAAIERRVVIKVLSTSLTAPVAAERFRQEIALLAGLQHPSIVPILSAGEFEGVPWFAMPFVQGETLRDRLRRGPLSVRETVQILTDVARALAVAHGEGVVHRDIKPENILLTDHAAVVADFGIAKVSELARRGDRARTISSSSGAETAEGTSVGTPLYMAPEQAAGDPNISARADLYAFGVVAYEMLTGSAPFAGLPRHELMVAQLTEMPTAVDRRRAGVPPSLAALVMRCLAKDPSSRPSAAREIVSLLQEAAMRVVDDAPVAPVLSATRSSRGRELSAWIAALREASRRLRKTPRLTIPALLCLTLGIGLVTALASAVDRALIAELPFSAPDRLVSIHRTTPQGRLMSSAPANVVDLESRVKTLVTFGALQRGSALVRSGKDSREETRARVTPHYFELLGVKPLLGRTLRPEDDDVREAPVAVVSANYWERALGSTTDLSNRTIDVDGVAHRVVGVLPAGFQVVTARGAMRADIYVPTRFSPAEIAGRRNNSLSLIGRLAPGVTFAEADRELVRHFDAITKEFPELAGESVRVVPMQDDGTSALRKPLLLLLVASMLVLLISTLNVASLILARGVERSRDIAVIVALGAERRDVIRTVLSEAVVITTLGLLGGFGVATLGVKLVAGLAAAQVPSLADLSMNGRALAFASLVSVVVALSCSAIPIAAALRVAPGDALRRGRVGPGRKQRRALETLVIVQVALAVCLLGGAVTSIRSVLALTRQDAGFATSRLLSLTVRGLASDYASADVVRGMLEPALAEIARIPGVEAVGAISQLPYREWGWNSNVRYDFSGAARPTDLPLAENRWATPSFFATTGQRIVSGRALAATDLAPSAPVAVVNEALVRRDFAGRDPIGARFMLGDSIPITIVGVVSDIRNVGPFREPFPEIYRPYSQNGDGPTRFSVVARTRSDDPMQIAQQVRDAVHRVAPTAGIAEMQAMDDVLYGAIGRPRLAASLLIAFSAVALLLALGGTYGLVSYMVAQRAREFGIRLALGSTPARVLGLVTAVNVRIVALGSVAGLLLAAAAGAMIGRDALGAPFQLAVVAPAVLLFLVAGVLINLVPGWRASRVDAASVIRSE